jgi:hypothetical protein
MATKQLFQILLKNRDGIKSGITKVQDIVTEYLSTTGARTISPDERFTINKEFSELAPSNVVNDIFGDFQGLQDDAADAVMDTPFTNKVREQNPDVEIRGNETFGELTEKLGKPKDQGLGSLYPRGEPGEIFDIQNDKRREVAEFMKEMRKAGIQNEDVMNTAKITDVAEGKRAATTLARANDMSADTKIKQEFLSDLDEMKADRGPRYFQGDDVGGPMGYDSYGEFLDSKGAEIINAIEEDLITKGVPEEKAEELLRYVRDLRRESTSPLKNDLKGLVDKIGDDLGDALDNEEIKIFYSTRFWNKYVDEILKLTQKPEPRFADGGLV